VHYFIRNTCVQILRQLRESWREDKLLGDERKLCHSISLGGMLCSSGGLRNPQERDVADKGFQLKVNSEDNIELILLQDLEMISEQRPLDFYELEELWS
jgi:hypothetical protein